MHIGFLSPGVKRPGRETNRLLLSIVDVKNEWSYTSAFSIRLRGVDGDIFTFTRMINLQSQIILQFLPHAEHSALKLVKPVGFALVLGGKSCIRSQSLRLLGNVAVVQVKMWAEQRCCAVT
jgi:hypothetical protein